MTRREPALLQGSGFFIAQNEGCPKQTPQKLRIKERGVPLESGAEEKKEFRKRKTRCQRQLTTGSKEAKDR